MSLIDFVKLHISGGRLRQVLSVEGFLSIDFPLSYIPASFARVEQPVGGQLGSYKGLRLSTPLCGFFLSTNFDRSLSPNENLSSFERTCTST